MINDFKHVLWDDMTLDSREIIRNFHQTQLLHIKLIPSSQRNSNKLILNMYIQCQSKASQLIRSKNFAFINFLHHIFAEIADSTWNSNRNLQFNFACKIVHTHMIAINENKQNQLLCERRINFFPSLDYFFLIFFASG